MIPLARIIPRLLRRKKLQNLSIIDCGNIQVEQDDLEREIGKKNQTSLLEKGTIRAQEDGVLAANVEIL